MKICSTCKIEKDESEYNVDRKRKDGLNYTCRLCIKIQRDSNRDKINQQAREYKKKNRSKLIEECKQYRAKNKDKVKEYFKCYRETHRDKINEYDRMKRKTDPIFRLKNNIRVRFKSAYRSQCAKKKFKTFDLVDIKAVYDKLGDIPKGMHIDHIIPISAFDLTNKEHLKLVFHPNNLQLLAGSENCSKNDKIVWELINADTALQGIAKTIGLKQE
jgi:hypothetical protein